MQQYYNFASKNNFKNLNLINWKNKKVGILGLGVEGLSSAKYLQDKGAIITILDIKEEGDFDFEILDIIVRSPGIRRNIKEIIGAEKEGVLITSQTQLFFDSCPCPIVGVTGTKGKGTTASLIYEMLKDSGKNVYLGGNIGKPSLEFLDKLNKQSIAVLELSSFQLQDLNKSPFIAVMLMTTSEHLDYHGDTREYVEAKRNILRFQTNKDFTILNRDYPATNESDIHTAGKIFYVSRERIVELGCFVKDGIVKLRYDERLGRLSRAHIIEKKVIDIENIKLRGKHNLENVCAAVMAATLAGATLDGIRKVLRSFKGLEHRFELIREVGGVKYIDDSFSTTPETAIAAIEAFKEPLILILGGSSKKSDFTELGQVISKAKNIKAIIGVGDEWKRIKSQISSVSRRIKSQSYNSNLKSEILLIEEARDMETIVKAAVKIAAKGDVVLLSPGCASFGMFANYKDRGAQFRKEVDKL